MPTWRAFITLDGQGKITGVEWEHERDTWSWDFDLFKDEQASDTLTQWDPKPLFDLLAKREQAANER